ncbi:TPA: hypothetical protein ACIZBK_003156 [Legionella pneumophila]
MRIKKININIKLLPNITKIVELLPEDSLKEFIKKIKEVCGKSDRMEVKLLWAGMRLSEHPELLDSLQNDTIVHALFPDKNPEQIVESNSVEFNSLGFVLPITEFSHKKHFETCSRAQPTLFQHKGEADCFIKKDLYDPYNAFFEVIAYRIFNLMGITVPHAAVIEEETDFYRIASFKLNDYRDLQGYFMRIEGSIKQEYSIHLQPRIIDEITEKNCINQLPLVGFADKNSCYYFCQDQYVLGWWYTNLGLIEHKDKFEVVKIDPSLYPRFKNTHSMPTLQYEEALSYFFGVKRYHPLFKATTPEQNIASFRQIAAIKENQLYEAVYVPGFEKFGNIISDRQNTLFENLKHRRNIFCQVYQDFYIFSQESKVEGNTQNLYVSLVNITEKRGIPPIIACVLIGNLELFQYCIEKEQLNQAYFMELRYKDKSVLEWICSLGLHHFMYFCSEKNLFSDEEYISYFNNNAYAIKLPLYPELFEFFLYKIKPSFINLELLYSDSDHLIKIFEHKIDEIIHNYKMQRGLSNVLITSLLDYSALYSQRFLTSENQFQLKSKEKCNPPIISANLN